MTRKSISTKREKIAQYWRDQIENKGAKVKINTSWENALTHCWACGNNFGGSLERCHIIPDALGGTNKVSNLFLMCYFCNKLNPETTYIEDFWLWVNSRDKDNMYISSQDPLGLNREFKLMYGFLFSEIFETMFKVKEGIKHMKRLQKRFSEAFYLFLYYNQDKFILRYKSTMAVALHKFIPIWMENNFDETPTLPPVSSLPFIEKTTAESNKEAEREENIIVKNFTNYSLPPISSLPAFRRVSSI